MEVRRDTRALADAKLIEIAANAALVADHDGAHAGRDAAAGYPAVLLIRDICALLSRYGGTTDDFESGASSPAGVPERAREEFFRLPKPSRKQLSPERLNEHALCGMGLRAMPHIARASVDFPSCLALTR